MHCITPPGATPVLGAHAPACNDAASAGTYLVTLIPGAPPPVGLPPLTGLCYLLTEEDYRRLRRLRGTAELLECLGEGERLGVNFESVAELATYVADDLRAVLAHLAPRFAHVQPLGDAARSPA